MHRRSKHRRAEFNFWCDTAVNRRSQCCCRERFVSRTEWPPKSPDYYFRSQVKTKGYEGRREPFQTLDQLKRRIKCVWNNVASLDEIRRAITQFRPRVRNVVTNKAGPIKAYFG